MLLTTAEAAAILRISPRSVRRLVDAGLLKTVRCGTSARSDRVHPDDLQDYINTARGLRGIACQSDAGATSGGSTSRSAVNALDDLLARELPGRKPRSSKRRSAPSIGGSNVVPIRSTTPSPAG